MVFLIYIFFLDAPLERISMQVCNQAKFLQLVGFLCAKLQGL